MERIKYMLNGERVVKQTGGYRTYIDGPLTDTITQEYIEDEGIKELLLEIQYQKTVSEESQETLLKAYNNATQDIQQYKQQIDEAIKFLNEYTISEPLNEVSSGLFISGMEEPEFLWKLYNILSKLKERDEK